MINKIKKALGIESIKIHIDMPPEIDLHSGAVGGELVFSTRLAQDVHQVRIILVETYKRGRRSSKRIDDYILGEWVYDGSIHVSEGAEYRLPFSIDIEPLESNMDRFQGKNILFRKVGDLAKLLKNANSTFTVIAEAKAKGTALHPVAKKELHSKR